MILAASGYLKQKYIRHQLRSIIIVVVIVIGGTNNYTQLNN